VGGPNYHPSLTDGTFDRRAAPQSRPDVPAVRQRTEEMQQTDAPDAGQILAEFDRTKRGEGAKKLQIALKTYENHPFVDCRIWWRRQDGTWMPTKRGITFRARELGDVQRALAEAAKRMGASQ